MMLPEMKRPEFQVHLLNEQGIAKAIELGKVFSDALDKIEALVRPAASGRW